MEAVQAVAEQPNQPQLIVIEPTVDPRLLPEVEIQKVNVEPGTVSFHPVLRQLVQTMGFSSEAQVTGMVLETNLGDVPELSGLGPPCTPGQSSWLTGYNWLTHAAHTAVDIACTDAIVASPSKAKVYAILWEAEAYQYGSSGQNVLVIAKIPKSYDMSGWLIFGTGHMTTDVPVQVGQDVEAGQMLGHMGATGNADGPHMHYYVVWLKEDGSTEFLDPNNWSAIGKR